MAELARRGVLVAIAGMTGAAGCLGNGDDEVSDEPDNGDDATAYEANEGGSGDANGNDEEVSESVTFDHPDSVRSDEPIEMTVDGLPEGTTAEITVTAEFDLRELEQSIIVETDDGRIDLDTAEVSDGEWQFEDDHVWDSLDVPPSVAVLQFLDVTWQSYFPPPEKETVTYEVSVDGETLGETSLTRTHPDFGAGSPVDHDDLVGEVFEPPGEQPAPGVLLLHGSGGSPMTDRAALLAQRGFTTLALQYFGGPGLPESLEEVPLEYVETAIDWLLEHDRVAGEQIGLYGVSRGGELALLTGSEYSTVGAVVSIAGSGVVWSGITEDGPTQQSAWSRSGESVPHVPYSLAAASDEEIAAATIPAEEIAGPVLLVSGDDDNLWNAVGFHNIAEERLTDHGHSAFEHLVYEEAGHAIRPPYYPVGGTISSQAGGSGRGNAEAAHDHWPRVIETFETLAGAEDG